MFAAAVHHPTQFNAPWAALVAFVSFVVYFVVTFAMTRWRKKIRKRMNDQVPTPLLVSVWSHRR